MNVVNFVKQYGMFVGAIIIRGCSARKRMIFTNEVIGSRLGKHNFRSFNCKIVIRQLEMTALKIFEIF